MFSDTKGALGLDTVKAFLMIFTLVAVMGMAGLILLNELSDSQVFDTDTSTITNETLTTVAEAGESLSPPSDLRDLSCTLDTVNNATGGELIEAGNYTQSSTGCILYFNNTQGSDQYNNTNWNVSYSYSYLNDMGTADLEGNVSEGVGNLFENSTTFFALLGVAVIILIIALVVLAVNRFSSNVM